MEKITEQSDRLVSLDYLRGYFVIVIIIDHLSRFPSLWQFITGQGILWATAAEGFVMISGLMIGYVRGRKSISKPFADVASKLLKRSVILYIWMVISSLVYIWLTWSLSASRDMPWYDAPLGDWATATTQVVTMQVPHLWVHFLYLYAIFLMFSIPAVWLLRKGQPWIVACLSLIGYIYGYTAGIEWLRWQIIFFVPAVAGFYLPAIKQRWHTLPANRVYTTLFYVSAIITVALSAAYVMFEQSMPNGEAVNKVFSIASFGPGRIAVAALWFSALLLLFNKITPWLQAHTRGIIHYLGTHSLTAYIAHGAILCAMALLIPATDNFFVNTIAGLLAVLGVYMFIKLPPMRRLLPR